MILKVVGRTAVAVGASYFGGSGGMLPQKFLKT